MKTFKVLNPLGEEQGAEAFIAPHIEDLTGRKVGLFWNGKHNGDVVLSEIGKQIKSKFTIDSLIRFDHGYEGIGPAAIKKIAESSDLVISSLGD
jgi:hypothetical protein